MEEKNSWWMHLSQTFHSLKIVLCKNFITHSFEHFLVMFKLSEEAAWKHSLRYKECAGCYIKIVLNHVLQRFKNWLAFYWKLITVSAECCLKLLHSSIHLFHLCFPLLLRTCYLQVGEKYFFENQRFHLEAYKQTLSSEIF